MAAKGEDKRAFVLINNRNEEQTLTLSVQGADLSKGRVKATDLANDFADAEALGTTVVLPPYGIRYVEI